MRFVKAGWKLIVSKIVTLRDGEAATALMMFGYSFLTMTSYNILKPITRSKYISALGADNLPYVQLAAGVLIGMLMHVYSWAAGRMPRRWVIPVTQAGEAALLVAFWFLFRTGADWVSVAFYVLALILGILLISQFWTLANDIYDARQAKRLFGFIGGGASLGGAMGAGITSIAVTRVGTDNLVLVSATILGACAALVVAIVRRERITTDAPTIDSERGVSGGEAIRMLSSSRHLQLIALVIGFAAIGAAIIEQQVNMAAEAMQGTSPDAITAFLAQVTFYLSVVGFFVQVIATSRIHRSLGLAFALLILPMSLGTTAVIILWSGALWTAGAARVLDASLRYTIDKTTREVLFLPLPVDLKYRAKPFVDVTVDRSAKAIGALMALVLIKPWGLHLDWQRLSYASLVVTGIWMFLAMRARGEYLKAFRSGIERRAIAPQSARIDVADAMTIELLVEELSSSEQSRVLYAIDMLDSLDRRNLITPLLLHHESPAVRARTLLALESQMSIARRWSHVVSRLLDDQNTEVRAAALHAIAMLHKEEAPTLMRRYLRDPEPRIAMTAARTLADSGIEADTREAQAALSRIANDTRQVAAPARREAAAALAHVENPNVRSLLLPLMMDSDLDVASAAIRSAHKRGSADALFVPALVALLGHRFLKDPAREALVSYGDQVIATLSYFLNDRDEKKWVRRHIPGTLACLPTQRSMDALVEALNDRDGFLRFKAMAAIAKLRRDRSDLMVDRRSAEAVLVDETSRYYKILSQRFNLMTHDADAEPSLLARALADKRRRVLDRIYQLLELIHPENDIAAARYALVHGDSRARAAAVEYVDNLLSRPLRKRVMPILDDLPMRERVRRANAFLKTWPRGLDATLAQLIHDADPVLSAAAIHYVARRQLRSLDDDLEYVCTHRSNVHDLVAEAASWALSSLSQSEDRDGPWLESLPTVEIADRLRRIPLFDFVPIDELFRIAGSGRQVIHGRGRELCYQGARIDEVQFLLKGRVQLMGGKGSSEQINSPAALTLHEMVEDAPARYTITALDRSSCLAFRSDQFLPMLSDNVLLAQGLSRMLIEAPEGRHRCLVLPALQGAELLTPRNGMLQPLEKVILLEQNPLLQHAAVTQLLDMAAIMREVPLVRDTELFREADEPAIYYVLSGEVRLEAETSPINAGPGTTIGVSETLAARPMGRRATVTRHGLALQVGREQLFDVLGEHVELLHGVVGTLLRANQVAAARDESLV